MVDTFIAFIWANYGWLGLFFLFMLYFVIKEPKAYWARVKAVARLIGGNHVLDTYDILQAKLKYYTDFKVDNLYLKDPGRREIFKDLLHTRFTVFGKQLELLHGQDFKNMQPGELYGMLVGCIHESLKAWTSMCAELGIPDIVIEKYIARSNKNIEFMLKTIEMVCYSSVYGDNLKRMQAVYSLYSAMFEVSMADAERSLNDINGELDGVKYKEFVCCG